MLNILQGSSIFLKFVHTHSTTPWGERAREPSQWNKQWSLMVLLSVDRMASGAAVRRQDPFPGGNVSPLEAACGARNCPSPSRKQTRAQARKLNTLHNNRKHHNEKMRPRRQAGAATQWTTMACFCPRQSSLAPSLAPAAE